MTLASSNSAHGEAVTDLQAALLCNRPFDPGSLLHALQRAGIIGTHWHTMIDGIPVFAVVKPTRIQDLNLKYVEGWDDTGGLFERAPGTPPGTYIAITVEGDRQTVERKFRQPSGEPTDRFTFYVTDQVAAWNYQPYAHLFSVVCHFQK